MSDKPVNVLITAASRRVALIRAFAEALKSTNVPGKVIVTDTDPLSPGHFFCEKSYLAPLSTSPEYISAIKETCIKEDITLLVPTIDEEIALFGKHKKEFAEIGVKIPVSNEKTGDICNDKYKTYLFFKENGLPMAETFLPDEIRKLKPPLPLFIKPRIGRGAIGAYPVNTEKELEFFIDYIHEPVIQTFLAGKEYTIDLLCDFKGRVISIVPRQRLVIRSGVCDRGVTEKNQKLMELCEEVAIKLGLVGPSNLQCMVDGSDITFFEINPRFSGAIQLTINAGADFPKMLVRMMNGGGVEPCIGEFEDNLTMVSYDESIYKPAGNDWRR